MCTVLNVQGTQLFNKEVIDVKDTYISQLCQKSADVMRYLLPGCFHLKFTGRNPKYLDAQFGYIMKGSKDFQEECCFFIKEFE